MTKKYTVTIAGKQNLERGVYYAAVFKNQVELVFSKDNEIVKTASLSAGQRSASTTLQSAKEKIALFCERLAIDESQLDYDRSDLPKIEKIVYKALSLGKKLSEAFIPVQWIIVYKAKHERTWKKIIPDSKFFQADPFIVFHEDKYYVFYEELEFKDDHGYLMAAELDIENGCLQNEKVILRKEYHLSYPCVFKENDCYYMIPESGDANAVYLYECVQFPYEWKKKKTLIDGVQAVDTTPLKAEDGWYLFTTEIKNGTSCNDELSIYKSEDLFNQPFDRVSEIPVVTNVSNARMAGHFHQEEGNIYRMSQNCGKRYGHQVNINRVLNLENSYQEEIIDTIKPDFPAMGLHTYNQAEDMLIADMEIPRFDWYSLKRYSWVQFKRLLPFLS